MPLDRGSADGLLPGEYLRVLRRRAWIAVQPIVLVPLAAVLLSLQQEDVYEASADVLLVRRDVTAALTDTPNYSVIEDADRFAETQASVARAPAVAKRALASAELSSRTPAELLAHSSVEPSTTADILTFTVDDRDPELASRLATAYAAAYARHRAALDAAPLRRARADVAERLAALRAARPRNRDLIDSVLEKQEQLRTIDALDLSTASVLRPAQEAQQVAPRPVRNGLVGLAIGLVLGVGLAFLRDALDPRVRTIAGVRRLLGLPFLGRLGTPPRRLRRRGRLVMLEDPHGRHAEQYRMLRARLDFAGARTILVTSAHRGERRTATVANLAVTFARAGRRVALVDLDVRKPRLHELLGLAARPGVTDVARSAGVFDLPERPNLADVAPVRAALDGALVRVTLPDADPVRVGGTPADDRTEATAGYLDVLPGGSPPSNPGEFVGSAALAGVLGELERRYDVVLLDAPPLFGVADARTLSVWADGIVVVVDQRTARRDELEELRGVLQLCHAVRLGFVATAVRRDSEPVYADDEAAAVEAPGDAAVPGEPTEPARR